MEPRQPQTIADLTISQFARQTDTSATSVRNKIASGQIPAYRVGKLIRIPAYVLEDIQCGGAFSTIKPVPVDADAEIDRIVRLAPSLTEAQRDRIATILRGSGDVSADRWARQAPNRLRRGE